MRTLAVLQQDAVALTAATVRSVLEITVPANRSVTLVRWYVEFDGTNAAAAPVLVQLVKTTATMTGTAKTPIALNDYRSDAIESAGKHSATVENVGTISIYEEHRIHPTSGFSYEYPLDREIECNTFLRLRCNAAAAVNVLAGLVFEE